MLNLKKKLIVALDVDNLATATELARELKPYVGFFKVGLELFYSCGPDVVRLIKGLGADVFIDLKLHDIPNTVAGAARALTRYGAGIINVHAAGGRAMMRAAAEAVRDEAETMRVRAPLVVAVTVLTSIDQNAFDRELGMSGQVADKVVAWSKLAGDCGLDGVVASPVEVGAIRKACGPDFVIITPGIRPAGEEVQDQKRTMTPGGAVAAGATYLVVGRPITGAPDRVAAARRVVEEMEAAQAG
ncbi:MAG: orotidine-5'-phosphate decarboxylase [Bacillota bacterium]|jgi:orotidine-5'-phosphate decarboxylase